MHMHLRQSNYHHVYKNAESLKWLQALVSETQLWDRATVQKRIDQKASVEGDVPQVATNLQEVASVYGVVMC